MGRSSRETYWSFALHAGASLLALSLSLTALILWARHNDLICGTSQPGYCSPLVLDDTGSAWHQLELSEKSVVFAVNYSLPLAEGRLTRLWLVHSSGSELDLCGGVDTASCQDLESITCLQHELSPPCQYIRGRVESELGELIERNSYAYQLRVATEAHPALAQCGVWQGSCRR